MHKGLIRLGSIFAAITVILGAFAAHALKEKLSAYSLSIFETGVRYQFYHSIAIILAAVIYKEYPSKRIVSASVLFTCGIFLFSGSLYILALNESSRWLGAITPFGGVCFIAGWLLLAFSALKKQS